MSILNYSGLLNAAGAQTPANRSLGVAGQLQGLGANKQALEMRMQQKQAEQQQAAQQQQARATGAELLKSGTPDEIASFGIKNPEVMKDFISAAKFKDNEAVTSRIRYAQDVLGGNANPREALISRIKTVTESGGDASGLMETLKLDDDGIRAAAEKDLAVIAPDMYSSYKSAIDPDADSSFAPQVSALQVDPQTGQKYTVITNRNTGESKRVDAKDAIGETLTQEMDRNFRVESLKDARQISKNSFEQLKNVKSSISTINEAIKAIDDGAESGIIDKYLPSFKESTIALENAAQRMGLDVVSATTFGALSEGELRLAMDTAMPPNLQPKELRTWLTNRKKAKNKLANELTKMAITLGKGKTTIAEYLEKNATFTEQQQAPQQQTGLQDLSDDELFQ